MNMEAVSSADRWLTPGCHVKDTNTTHTVCHCYHLTNFAVLMDVYNKQGSVSYDHNQALGYISYIGSGLSILGCLALILAIRLLRISNDNVHIHQQLGISILLTQVLFLIMDGVEMYSGIPFWACYTIAALLHYTLMAMFCWMLVEGFHLYVKLVWVFKVGSYLKRYLAVSWGCPLIVIVLSTSIYRNQYKHETLCWLDNQVLLVCLVPVFSFVILVNTVILGIVIRVLLKSRNMTNKKSLKPINNIKLSLKASVVLLPLLGLTWVFAYMAVATDGSQLLYYIFTYLFTITNSCQGILFFIFHGLLNLEMQAALKRRFMKSKKEKSDTTDSRMRKTIYIEGDFDTLRPNGRQAFEMNSMNDSISSTTIGNCTPD